ncbi:D-glycero-beta-D-manno-heptose 1,7-bisphosphate 7-phosphatase [Campylobacter sp. FMV-PI01]|uniref:D,D-heptose 1,7-bisphosphate phosphatase n=1 Tax=Campylobacter portucalensis TaxID=2608384 RepID=A0A6L5WJC2_9BACT|nr:D-glycero-beta-D-manno-heptose 1,7-bisphosphate 7-phosphatase [Campylobacter portucalensis]MSN96115.1 D-glycero-beta-D-manno-heptose 1,7-bisphosphate 7-phosphatase [Campylobacter portucalensis]
MKNYIKRAIFLDRDGVINEDFGYVYEISKFKFKDGIFETLKELQNLGFLLIIITNQSGISRGYYTKKDFEKLTNFMLDEFLKNSVVINRVYFCPHIDNEKCSCRKPNPGMILKAKDDFDLDLKNSFLIGDKVSDMQAGKNAGIKNLFLLSKNQNLEYNTIKNIKEILKFVKEN